MNYVQLLNDVRREVVRFYQSHEADDLAYHNLYHTETVVANAGRIARHYELNDRDFFVVVTAAWFHDAGYYICGMEGHEDSGADMAVSFLRSKGVEEAVAGDVHRCILATRMPQAPKDLLEQIVCDADLYHLGTPAFADQNKKMRKEMEMRSGKKISKQDWRQSTIALLEAHRFQTDYAQKLLNEGKESNLEKLKQRFFEKEEENKAEQQDIALPGAAPAIAASLAEVKTEAEKGDKTQEKDKKKLKADRPNRGIETMFRISSNNHQRLSDMADNKAHIMITTTSIILSVLLSVLLRKLEDNPHLVFPTILLLTICVVTMVCCILATRPALPNGTFTTADIDEKKVNLLFFGNFYKMNYEDYASGMQRMMGDREFLYGSLTRDVYSQGIVLGRKYKLLRTGYNVFMFGIIASVLSFLLAVVVFGG